MITSLTKANEHERMSLEAPELTVQEYKSILDDSMRRDVEIWAELVAACVVLDHERQVLATMKERVRLQLEKIAALREKYAIATTN
jgi:hypothetical protein